MLSQRMFSVSPPFRTFNTSFLRQTPPYTTFAKLLNQRCEENIQIRKMRLGKSRPPSPCASKILNFN